MAGMVCHEISQPLMAISGYSELLMMDAEKDEARLKLGKIMEQVKRLGTMTEKLLNITRYETKTYLQSRIIDLEKASP